MKARMKLAVSLVSILVMVLFCAVLYSVADEHNEHKGSDRAGTGKHRDKDRHGDRHNGQLAPNASYSGSCGGCHWAYPPALLPSASWANVMANLNNHFGAEVVLTPQQVQEVSAYLNANSSERSSSKIGRKITQSLAGASPERIVDVPYIQKKHRKIDRQIFARKGVGSLSNCIACHPSAVRAGFDDDDVVIPAE